MKATKTTRPPARTPGQRRQAFTLIELLVVIAIIAILASMILPALSRAKDKAIVTIDRNNNRQMLLGCHSFTADNNDVMPGPGWGNDYDGWLYPKNSIIQGSGYGSYAAAVKAASNQVELVKRGQIWPYCPNIKAFMCPLDITNGPAFANAWATRGVLVCSYVWNGSVIAYGDNAKLLNPYKLADFKPTDVLSWETSEQNPFFFNDSSSFPTEGLSYRHSSSVKNKTYVGPGGATINKNSLRGGASIGLFGGSVGYIGYQEYYKLADSNKKNILWNSPKTADGH